MFVGWIVFPSNAGCYSYYQWHQISVSLWKPYHQQTLINSPWSFLLSLFPDIYCIMYRDCNRTIWGNKDVIYKWKKCTYLKCVMGHIVQKYTFAKLFSCHYPTTTSSCHDKDVLYRVAYEFNGVYSVIWIFL